MIITPELLCLALFVTTIGLLMWGFPVAFTLAGSALLFAGIGALLGVFDAAFLLAFPQRVFAIMTNQVLIAVTLFVFMGVMLERSKVAEDLLENMGRLFGERPGGLAISVTLVGALLAASSGIVGATVVTMGLLSLPTMLKHGYAPSFATGTIATSGTLGQIIPPSIVLVLLGDQLSSAYQSAQFKMGIFAPETVSVNDLFLGALVPGLLLVGLYLAYQVAVAVITPSRCPPVRAHSQAQQEGEAVTMRSLAASLLAPLMLIVAVLGAILLGIASTTEVAAVGAVGALMLAGYKIAPSRAWPIIWAVLSFFAMLLLVAMFGRLKVQTVMSFWDWIRLALGGGLALIAAMGIVVALRRTAQSRLDDGSSVLQSVMGSTLRVSAMVFLILIGASMFSLVFRGFGGDELVEDFLKNLPGGAIGAVLVVMLVMFVLGFFLDFLEIIFIVVPIVAPILLQMEIAPGQPMSPVWLGVLMAVNLQMSFLTPPFGFSLFYLRGVAPDSVRTVEIYRGIIPYVGLQLLALLLLWFFPGLSTALPQWVYGS